MAGPQLSVEMTGDEARLFKSLQKVISQNQKLEQSFDKTRQTAKKTSDDTARGFSQLGNSIKQHVVGIASVATAWQAVTDALRGYDQALKDTMSQAARLAQSRQSLSQIATDTADLNKMNQRADSAAVRFGVERAIAREVLFSARSENWSADYEKVLALNQVYDAESAARVAGQVPALFNNKITPMQSINALATASGPSRLRFQELAAVLPEAAAGANMLGSSPEETMAALGVLAKRYGSPSTTSTGIAGYGAALGLDPRFQGKGLIETTRMLQGMSPDERSKVLGSSQELNKAYLQFSSELQNIADETAKIRQQIALTNTDQSYASQRVRNRLKSNDLSFEMQQAKIAEVRAQIASERALGRKAASSSIADERTRQFLNTADMGFVDYTRANFANTIGETIGLSGEQREGLVKLQAGIPDISGLSDVERFVRNGISDRNTQQITERLDRLIQLMRGNTTLAEPDADR